MSGLVEWALFLGLATVCVLMAAGMLVTMSMYRAGLALMSSFVALAGLFILLDADLMALIQLMMNVGGMMVMILFMVMLMMDPGGEMMWDMKRKMNLPGPGALSMTMPRGTPPAEQHAASKMTVDPSTAPDDWTCPMHPEVSAAGPGACPKCGMPLMPRAPPQSEHQHAGETPTNDARDDMVAPGMARMDPRQHYQMMVDMAMSTAQLPWALAVGAASAALLAVLMVRTAWTLSPDGPAQDSTTAVGELLLSRYMLGFEGAAFLILAGMVGAVIFARHEKSLAPVSEASNKEEPKAAASRVYTCPMHPEVRRDAPGQCPKCGMDLVPAPTQAATAGGHEEHGGGG